MAHDYDLHELLQSLTLKGRCTRVGDSRPYGGKGTRGLYREGGRGVGVKRSCDLPVLRARWRPVISPAHEKGYGPTALWLDHDNKKTLTEPSLSLK
eukprot:scaffold53716_cov27-Tisochrysis_lutea.AAC.2